jgi:hypothetical protein
VKIRWWKELFDLIYATPNQQMKTVFRQINIFFYILPMVLQPIDRREIVTRGNYIQSL